MQDFLTAIGHADRLMRGTKSGRGQPTNQEKSMFVAATVLTYAAWEGYVEDVAVEVTEHLSRYTNEQEVPKSVRKTIEDSKPILWELSVYPGFRGIWRQEVTRMAKGASGDRPSFGMNTANVKNVIALFEAVGLDPWRLVAKEDKEGVESLVRLRGTVAHTAGTPENFNKGIARDHFDRIKRVVAAIDESIGQQADDLTGHGLW